MTGYDRVIQALESHGHTLHGTSTTCPAHDDNRASLSVREADDGKALVYCHAGCDYHDIVQAIGLNHSDLWADHSGRVGAEEYVYTDVDGKPFLRVVRVQPKGFYQEHWEDGGWQYGGVGDERPLYNLPAVIAADQVVVVEGEKDADLLNSLGYVATTLGGSTQRIRGFHVAALAGKAITIIADNDGPGKECAERWQATVGGDILYPRVGKDFTDHYNAGYDFGDLLDRPGQSDVIEWLSLDGDEEEIEWLMEPLLPRGAYVTIYGSAGAGKSYVALAVLVRLAELGYAGTFYSEENPTRVERRRLKRLGADMSKLRVASQQGVDLGNKECVDAICERDKGQDVILVDSYSVAYSTRELDENARAVAFSRIVHRIIRETGATVVVVDHSGFDDSRLRGASSKGQQADVVIHMKEAKDGWRGRGDPYEFTLINEKASRFENPFKLHGALMDVGEDIELRWTTMDQIPAWYGTAKAATSDGERSSTDVAGVVEPPRESSSPLQDEAPAPAAPISHKELRMQRAKMHVEEAAALALVKEVFDVT